MEENKQMRNYTMKNIWVSVLLLFALGIPSAASAVDIDGDGEADFTVFRGSLAGTAINGRWFLASSVLESTLEFQWGLDGDFPVSGSYGTGTADDLAVWRPTDGVWYIRDNDQRESDVALSSARAFQWGLDPSVFGDSPQPCDYNGDGVNELALFRSSSGQWLFRNSTTDESTYSTASSRSWGLDGDTPVPADYDGDGECDIAVFREGVWFVITSSNDSSVAIRWGADGDTPVPGDYDGDGILDFSVTRFNSSGTLLWLVRKSGSLSSLTTFATTIAWGQTGDIPIGGTDFDDDGTADIAIFRPSSGVWFILNSEEEFSTASAQQFGLSVDIPVGETRGADPS